MYITSVVSFILFLLSDNAKERLEASRLLDTRTFEVCLSPGCLADGAEDLLSTMQAISPPNFEFKAGVCCSLCGNGPIILDETANRKYKKATEKKLLDILFEDGMSSDQEEILGAINFVSEANDARKRKSYDEAVQLYEKGIKLGLTPSLNLEATRTACKDGPPPGLQWIIQARLNEAASRLEIEDSAGALNAAMSACELSRETSPEAFELLHQVHQANGNAEGELKALKSFFDLPEPANLTILQSNRRRTLGFRLANLERQIKH